MNTKKSTRNADIVNLIFASIIIALIIVLTFTSLGYPKIFAIELTIIHIPVLVGAIVLEGKYGILLGAVYGVSNFIMALSNPTMYAPFTNPLVSVLPRIIFGFAIPFIHKGFLKLFKGSKLAIPFTMGFSTLLHTVLVLPILYVVIDKGWFLAAGDYIPGMDVGLLKVFYAILISNAAVEIGLAVVVGTAITIPLLQIKEKEEIKEKV